MFRSIKALPACAAAATVAFAMQTARVEAQSANNETIPLPPVVVEQSAVAAPKAKKKAASKKAVKQAQPVAAAPAEPANSNGVGTTARAGSLSVANTAEARADMQQTPGGVELVPDTAYKGSTPAASVKDVLDYVPGVFVQPKWGDDTR
ncbi:MAG TPA: TonB-dependent receptor, partial [Hyphomicrobium sp.]|nr:TonB-dependent receptor [Hyphomicrobium sp.]